MKGKQVEVFKADFTTKHMYDFYAKKTFKTKINKNYRIDKNSPFYMSKSKYTSIIKSFNKEIRDLLLYESFEFRMPCNLGVVSIVKKKVEPYLDKNGNLVNPSPINKGATRKLWERDEEARKNKTFIYHDNSQSDGYLAKLYYHRNTAKFVNKSGYNLRNSRGIKNKLKEIMNDPFSPYDFFTIEEYRYD